MRDQWLFGLFPYAAVALAVLAPGVRYARRGGASRVESDLKLAGRLIGGGAAWRWGIGVVALVHLIGLVIPRGLLAWNESPARLYMLEGVAIAAGFAALGGLFLLVKRQITAPHAAGPATLRDTAVVGLLLVAAGSGLAAACLYRWGTSWGAVTLTPYVLSLARLDPEVELIARMPFLVKLHVFSSFAFVAGAAFTPLASVGALPLCRLWGRAWPPVRLRLVHLRQVLEAQARRRWEALQAWREEES